MMKLKLIYLSINYSAYIEKMIKLSYLGRRRRIRKYLKQKNNSNQSNNNKYSLTDILNFPEGFLTDKIFKIVYDSKDMNNS